MRVSLRRGAKLRALAAGIIDSFYSCVDSVFAKLVRYGLLLVVSPACAAASVTEPAEVIPAMLSAGVPRLATAAPFTVEAVVSVATEDGGVPNTT